MVMIDPAFELLEGTSCSGSAASEAALIFLLGFDRCVSSM